MIKIQPMSDTVLIDSIVKLQTVAKDTSINIQRKIDLINVKVQHPNFGYWDMQFKDWINVFIVIFIPLSIFLLQAKEKANKENGSMKTVRRRSFNNLKLIQNAIEEEIYILDQTIESFKEPETVHIGGQVIDVPFKVFQSMDSSIMEDVYNYRLAKPIELTNYGLALDNLNKTINTLENVYNSRIEYTDYLSNKMSEFNSIYTELLFQNLIPSLGEVKKNNEKYFSNNLVDVATLCLDNCMKNDNKGQNINVNWEVYRKKTILPFVEALKSEFPSGNREFQHLEALRLFWESNSKWRYTDLKFSDYRLTSQIKFEHTIKSYDRQLEIINAFIKLHEHSTYKKRIFSF